MQAGNKLRRLFFLDGKTIPFKYKMKGCRELDSMYKMKLQYFLNDTTI